MSTGRSPFVGEGLRISLQLVRAGDRGWGVRELAHELDVSPSMVSRVVHTLEAEGLVRRVATRRGQSAKVQATVALFWRLVDVWPVPTAFFRGPAPVGLAMGGGPSWAALGVPTAGLTRFYVRSKAELDGLSAQREVRPADEADADWAVSVLDLELAHVAGPVDPVVAALELGRGPRGRALLASSPTALQALPAPPGPLWFERAAGGIMTIELAASERPFFDSVVALSEALGAPPTLVGGWAVACRLRLLRAPVSRPTIDLDVLIAADLRPAHDVLRKVGLEQVDPRHAARVRGLPLDVDLLAPSHASSRAARAEASYLGTEAEQERADVIVDDDGLALVVAPMGDLLERASEPVALRLGGAARNAVTGYVRVPAAGALVVAKLANLALENRPQAKLASDAHDILELVLAATPTGLIADLRTTELNDAERPQLAALLPALPGSTLETLWRAAALEPDRITRAAAAYRNFRRTLQRLVAPTLA